MSEIAETLQMLVLSDAGIPMAAAELAQRYGFVPTASTATLSAGELHLQWQGQVLSCCFGQGKQQQCLNLDFTAGKNQHRRLFGGGRNQPLARAVGIKAGFLPQVLDVTAGLGRDAFVLASLGCQVDMLERSPVMAALLDDALQRAASHAEVSDICQRMHLLFHDSRDYLQQLTEEQYPDTIYLDPMYPERRKSALVKKEMRLLQQLVGKDEDSGELLLLALQRANKRVTVKRPKNAEYLAGIEPHASINSPNTRYDIYLPQT
ncbi:MAG: class I SAM-dependent methyltransferase [Chromatiales bacterium]